MHRTPSECDEEAADAGPAHHERYDPNFLHQVHLFSIITLNFPSISINNTIIKL